MSTILPTENQDWGFWGTMREHAAPAWPIAFTAIQNATSIRQVGPNKQGANGSYTVYRVAE